VLDLMLAFLAAIRIFFRTRLVISVEVLALRQQVAVLKRKRPRPSYERVKTEIPNVGHAQVRQAELLSEARLLGTSGLGFKIGFN
jgi:hypothetical protein